MLRCVCPSFKDGSEATANARDSTDMLTSTADGVTDQSGGGHQGTHQDHKISSLVQAASKALSGQQQQSLLGAAAAHSHLHNDNVVSEAGMPSVKAEPSSVNSLTHVAAGRVGPRPGGAGVAPPLPSIPGQGTLKAGTLPCSSVGKTQVRRLFGGRGGGGAGGTHRSAVVPLKTNHIYAHICLTLCD